ncbi:MAG: hypothetical protein Q8Q02_03405 [Nocardioides sp.]|nr:hypothetical protein [Nocardioides sp.]
MSKQRAALRAQQEAKRQRAKRERAANGGGPQQPRARTRPPRGRPGQPTGTLARRSRRRTSAAVVLALLAQVAAWFLWQNWAANLAVFILTVLLATVVLGLLRRRR